MNTNIQPKSVAERNAYGEGYDYAMIENSEMPEREMYLDDGMNKLFKQGFDDGKIWMKNNPR